MDTLLIASDENEKQIPNVELAQKIYLYEYFLNKDDKRAAAVKEEILNAVKEDKMSALYEELCKKFDWIVDEAYLTGIKYESMYNLVLMSRAEVEAEVLKIEEDKKNAVENAGDMEVLDALFAKGKLYCRVGDWEAALRVFDTEILTFPKITTSKKIDALSIQARIAIFKGDVANLGALLVKVKALNEVGGDWDRRNRLKIYEGLYHILNKDIVKAAPLLLDCFETFTCVELCTYKSFMLYAITCNIVALPRTALYKKVIRNPQVIVMLKEIPYLSGLLHSIYECRYADFFRAMLNLENTFLEDRYLGPVSVLFQRECRVLAYLQYLEAYNSVKMESMAAAFNLTVPMIDTEISRFIAANRIKATIDKVGGMIENTGKSDCKTPQYLEVIRKGDVILNQIQKLARALDM